MAIGHSIRTIIVLSEEDISNPLHPNLWRELCEQLGIQPLPDGRWPTEVQIATRSVECHF